MQNGNVGIGILEPTEKLDVTGNAKVSGNVTVQSGKGIIRSSNTVQQKIITTTFILNNIVLGGNGTTNFPITWSETFGAIPVAYVGNITTGSSGVAETMLVLTNVTTTGATVWVHNTNTTSLTANFTVNLVAMGAQ